ncbi:MAG: hypothetical protein AMS27_09010 [Bacteroides sp. SM23_62_1]|nr:MAG: hypothetical protein AMS27_09010 [Bacteroides sp. SM23_62_1]
MNKIIVFGAGRIGRSFIGQIFSRGGYEVIFIDINKNLIDLLNQHKAYKVIIKGQKDESIEIKKIRGVHFDDKKKVIDELCTTSIVTVSAGQAALPGIIRCIGESLLIRYKNHPGSALDIIIAENIRDGAGYFRKELYRTLGENFPLDRVAGLIETSIGKMVPPMTEEDLNEDPLQIFAEPYNTLIVDKKGFKNPIPDLPWLAPKENMKAWVDRKSYIHNLGHATAAYTGFLKFPRRIYLFEILEDQEIMNAVRNTMIESAKILIRLYPAEFDFQELRIHIDDLLNRFGNRALKDIVFRIGCDLMRKLGPGDRLVSPIHDAVCYGMAYDKILFALICGFYFRAKDEAGNYYPTDEKFFNNFTPDIEKLLINICKFDPENDKQIILKAKEYCKIINKIYKPEIVIN